MGSHGIPEGLRSLQKGHVPSYAFPEAAARALGRAVEYARGRARPVTAPPAFDDADPARARAALDGAKGAARASGGWLPPDAVRAILAAYGLVGAVERVEKDAASAVAAARAIGYPVAVKLGSRTLTHQSHV